MSDSESATDGATVRDPMDYLVVVSVHGQERSLQFWVHGRARLPRVGEEMDFNGPEGDNLSLRVTDVRHTFSVPSDRDHGAATVYAILDYATGDSAEELALARRLLEAPALTEWTRHFPMLSPDTGTVAYEVQMREYLGRPGSFSGPR